MPCEAPRGQFHVAIMDSEELLYAGFNQDASCFALGTEKGLKIFSSYPLRFSFDRGIS